MDASLGSMKTVTCMYIWSIANHSGFAIVGSVFSFVIGNN